ncbi:MAG: hypothetical protein AAF329_13370 [Cyanobacteria bacterium P01_A01_bin.17]
MFVKEIVFTKEFTSPVFGNVYIGKEVKAKQKEAEKLVENGFAKFKDAPKAKKVKKEEAKHADKSRGSETAPESGSDD